MSKLNIWWLSQYASTPDQQFTAQHDLAKRLVEKGHRVTFFAAGFSHYKFKEIRLQPGEAWRADDYDGVRFVWIKTSPYSTNDWRRVLNICTYAWRAYRLARGWEESPDVIIGTTFHPLASLAACALSRSKRKPFVFEVKDLWPLSMIEFGRLRSKGLMARSLRLIEKRLARRAARIMTTLPGAADYYGRLGISRQKITWIPNGVELSRYAKLKPYSGQLSGSCTLVYAGGHVQASALDTVLRAARIEQENGNKARFIFVGGGQEKPRLIQMAGDLKLGNVEFRDAVPKKDLFRVMEQADLFVVTMRNLPGLYRYGISFNKLCDYLASGRPVLFAGNTTNNVVEEFRCGMVVPPEDPNAFAAAIGKFINLSREERAEMGENAIRCARERFDIDMLAKRLEQMLVSVAQESTSRARESGPTASTPEPSSKVDPLSQAH